MHTCIEEGLTMHIYIKCERREMLMRNKFVHSS
jgi:hypothetical protein